MYLTSVFAEWIMAIIFMVFMVTFNGDLKKLESADLPHSSILPAANAKAKAKVPSTNKDARKIPSDNCIITENNNIDQC